MSESQESADFEPRSNIVVATDPERTMEQQLEGNREQGLEPIDGRRRGGPTTAKR